MTTPNATPKGLDWIASIETAVGARIGTPQERRAFAESAFGRLGGAYSAAWRAQNEYYLISVFQKKVQAVQAAIIDLEAAVFRDAIGAYAFRLSGEELAKTAAPLLALVFRAEKHMKRGNVRAMRPKPGRHLRGSVEIAQMVAEEYDKHFGQPPGRSKQGAINNPFTRICKAVERLLESVGHKEISLGDKARSEGIDRYCEAAIRRVRQLGPQDSYVSSGDPRKRLLRDRAELAQFERGAIKRLSWM